MHSPKRSPRSKPPKVPLSDDLARVHCVAELFPQITGEDPFLARQMKEAIERSILSNPNLVNDLETFTRIALELGGDWEEDQACSAFAIDFGDRGWDPLFAREEFVRQLKKSSGLQKVVVLVAGLKGAIQGAGRYETQRIKQQYAEAVAYLDDLAARWSTPSTQLQVLYLA